jgi:MFS family permease
VKSTRQRAREALRSDDFRRLFAIRLITQSGDGLFQAALVSSIVFNPEEQNTILGFAIATLVVSLPFSILGPFTGVFIDRWSRRRILVVAPRPCGLCCSIPRPRRCCSSAGPSGCSR